MIAAEKKSLDILQYQKDKGYASGVDLAQQVSALAAAEATLPPLIKQEAQYHDQLAVLVGKFPSEAPPETLKLSDLTLPADLPVSLPSTLVTQRPDVMQAESNMHAASAQIGIAVANRLPNITLVGQCRQHRAGVRTSSSRPAPNSGPSPPISPRRSSMAARCCIRNARRAPPSTPRRRNTIPPCWAPSRMSPIR